MSMKTLDDLTASSEILGPVARWQRSDGPDSEGRPGSAEMAGASAIHILGTSGNVHARNIRHRIMSECTS